MPYRAAHHTSIASMVMILSAEDLVAPAVVHILLATTILDSSATIVSKADLRLKAKEKKHSGFYETLCTLHHFFVFISCVLLALKGGPHFPSLFTVAAWWIYSDAYRFLFFLSSFP